MFQKSTQDEWLKTIQQRPTNSSPDINKTTHSNRARDKQKDRKFFQKHVSHTQNRSNSKSSSKFRINYAELELDSIYVRCRKDSHLAKDYQIDK